MSVASLAPVYLGRLHYYGQNVIWADSSASIDTTSMFSLWTKIVSANTTFYLSGNDSTNVYINITTPGTIHGPYIRSAYGAFVDVLGRSANPAFGGTSRVALSYKGNIDVTLDWYGIKFDLS